MCHGHPHYHPCSHTSVKWLYCPEAVFDLSTGYEAPCANPIYSTAQPANTDCPLQNCNFKALKGSWTCCVCGKGPNTQGWCTVLRRAVEWNPLTKREEDMDVPCGHGCCSKCSRYPSSRGSSPETSFAEGRKGRTGRKGHGSSRASGHKRSSTYDFGGNFSPVVEGDESAVTSSSATHGSRSSRKPTYDTSVEYSPKKSKTSNSSKKKGHKIRSHH
ncbi:hypothetical protein F5Y19DRAFT_480322 [Xylariaceae sp. FL1651]|nr:hypothetical protein F5Y19DRAFT_480322 [Xylariaceae sp. FL1651]